MLERIKTLALLALGYAAIYIIVIPGSWALWYALH